MTPSPDQMSVLADGPLYWFRDWPNEAVPQFAAGVYTIWHRDNRFIYVGMSGRNIMADTVPRDKPFGLHTGVEAVINSAST
jgi:hypothetical protein